MTLLALLPRFWREALIAGLILAMGLLWLGKATAERRSHRLEERLGEATQLIERERAAVRAATALARARDDARVARTERDQAKVSQEVKDDYQTKLGDLRRRHDAWRLHERTAAAAAGGGRGASVPGLPDAARGADGAADKDRLPAADALIASEQALRLKALQSWVAAQAEIERGAAP
jgi:hypothetical protein